MDSCLSENFELNLDIFTDSQSLSNDETSNIKNEGSRKSQSKKTPKIWQNNDTYDCVTYNSNDNGNETDIQKSDHSSKINRIKNSNRQYRAPYPPETIQFCIDLFESGWAVQKISKATKISQSTIHHWTRKAFRNNTLHCPTRHMVAYYKNKKA